VRPEDAPFDDPSPAPAPPEMPDMPDPEIPPQEFRQGLRPAAGSLAI
jgi:hypothetical protein